LNRTRRHWAHGIENRYVQAAALLEKHKDRLTFPVDRFRWHTAQALISAASEDTSKAKVHANQALRAAASDRSGFRYHPTVGVVTKAYDGLVHKLKQYGDA